MDSAPRFQVQTGVLSPPCIKADDMEAAAWGVEEGLEVGPGPEARIVLFQPCHKGEHVEATCCVRIECC